MRISAAKFDEYGDISLAVVTYCERQCSSSRRIFIPSFLIRLRSVEGGRPRIAAAPCGPEIRPLVWRNTIRMWARSFSLSDTKRLSPTSGIAVTVSDSLSLIDMAGSTRIAGGATVKIAPAAERTARSTRFSSSRTLPGQLYCSSAWSDCLLIERIERLNRALYLSMKCCTSNGMSAYRSRSGGSVIGKTLRR